MMRRPSIVQTVAIATRVATRSTRDELSRASLVVAMFWLAVACQRADPARSVAAAAGDARQAGGAAAFDPSPRRLAPTATSFDPLDADATALGRSLDVRLVRELQGMNGTARGFRLLLVVSGTGTLVVPIEGEGFGADGESEPDAVPVGTLVPVEPMTPIAVWDDSDMIKAPLPVRAPLLYRASFHIPGGNDDVAVVHDGDRLKTFYFWRDEGSWANGWELEVDVRLAPGAKVRAR